MDGRRADAGMRQPPHYPLKRDVFDGDEVYAFGRWLPTVEDYDRFLRGVVRERHRLEGARRVRGGGRPGWWASESMGAEE